MVTLSTVFMIASLYAFQADSGPIVKLKSSFDSILDYTCILESFVRKGDKKEVRTYEYRYMKPGWVYMKILKGDNKGAVVIYNPETGKVRARKGGILGAIKLTFDPTDKKVLSIRGHRVDESHMGAILNRWLDYLTRAKVEYKGETTVDSLKGPLLEATECDTAKYHGTWKEILLLDADNHLPVLIEQFDRSGKLIHRVRIKDLKLNTGLKKEDFKL
ncbi:MAG: DUF1571 domain-containing protein [Candidatus Hydrothermae bacterium]|nr:DUF1571 domain-containing protein [Candidatus Hydrothermae bacterium]